MEILCSQNGTIWYLYDLEKAGVVFDKVLKQLYFNFGTQLGKCIDEIKFEDKNIILDSSCKDKEKFIIELYKRFELIFNKNKFMENIKAFFKRMCFRFNCHIKLAIKFIYKDEIDAFVMLYHNEKLICSVCGKKETKKKSRKTKIGTNKFLICPKACDERFYCSTFCKRKDWIDGHRDECINKDKEYLKCKTYNDFLDKVYS